MIAAKISQNRRSIEHVFRHPGNGATQALQSFAAFDVGSSHVIRDVETNSPWWTEAMLSLQQEAVTNVGIVDNTSLHNAIFLIDPTYEINNLNATHVLDLATVLKAFVFEDKVVHLEADSGIAARARRLFGTAVPLESYNWEKLQPQGRLLDHFWTNAEIFCADFYRQPHWVAEHQKIWSERFGLSLTVQDAQWPATTYREYFSSVESIAVNHAIVSFESINEVSAADAFGYSLGLTQHFVVESCLRAAFYQMLGNAMQAEYYANAYRAPLCGLIASEYVDDSATHLQHIYTYLEPNYQKAIDAQALIKDRVPVPFILSAVLRRAGRLEDIPSATMELREAMRPLRERRRELEGEIRLGNLAAIERIGRAINEDAVALAQSRYFTQDVPLGRLVVGIGGARTVFGALGHLLVHFAELPDEAKLLLKARLVKPQFWALTTLAAEARQCANGLVRLLDLLKGKQYFPKNAEVEQIKSGLKKLFA